MSYVTLLVACFAKTFSSKTNTPLHKTQANKQTSKACKTKRGKAKHSEAAAFPTKTQRKQIVKDRFALLRELGMNNGRCSHMVGGCEGGLGMFTSTSLPEADILRDGVTCACILVQVGVGV